MFRYDQFQDACCCCGEEGRGIPKKSTSLLSVFVLPTINAFLRVIELEVESSPEQCLLGGLTTPH